LRLDPASASACKAFRIAQLVIIKGVGQRHHDGWPSDDTEFGNGRGPGPADHQMCVCDSQRHIHEKRPQIKAEIKRLIGSSNCLNVLRAALLGEAQMLENGPGQFSNDLRHEFRKEACALAAAKNQQIERLVCTCGRIRRGPFGHNETANRIAGHHKFGFGLFRQFCQ
jgi:hypothetical protein